MRGFADDKAWADLYVPQIRKIVKSLAGDFITIEIANPEDDCKKATDYNIITVKGTSIGCRLRKGIEFFYRYGDITFRESRPSGVTTEIEKIKTGVPRWYLYGWVENEKISHWIFIDMDRFRRSNVIDCPDDRKTNYDGTTFRGYKVSSLNSKGCLKHFSKPVGVYLESLTQANLVNYGVRLSA